MLSRYLAAQGIGVLVVSLFDGNAPSGKYALEPGLSGYCVSSPRPFLVGLLVRLKRLMNRNYSARPDAQTDPGSVPGNTSHNTSVSGKVRKWFFRIAYIIDKHKRWSLNAGRAGIELARSHNVIAIVASGPPFSTLLAGAYAARHIGAPLIADFRDPWTDHEAALDGTMSRFELRMMRLAERMAIRQAAAITSTGAKLVQILLDRYDIASRTRVIRNGYDGSSVPPMRTTGHRLSLLFAGELYLQRNPFPLLEAIDRLLAREGVESDRVEMIFMGRCSMYGDTTLASWLSGRLVEKVVRILPQQTLDRVAEATRNATVLVNFAQYQVLSVPAKTFEHLASGRELLILSEGNSETSLVTGGIRGVNRVDPGDGSQLDAVLADLYQRHVVEGIPAVPDPEHVRRFSREHANQQFLSIIRGFRFDPGA
jgi:hypothetical protein